MPESNKEKNAAKRTQPEDEPGYDPAVSDKGSSTLLGGTRVMPMPDNSPTVAGMPRKNRVHTEPGNPGVPAPELQVTEGKPAKKAEQ
jgi:hypothetical protein